MGVEGEVTAKRLQTGIAGFDAIADGGLPTGGVTVLLGGTGVGKTIFGMQVLAHAVDRGAPGILVAFEESASRVVANMSGFAWTASAGRVLVIDAQLSDAVEHGGEFDLLGLLAIVGAKATQIGARCVVFDGLDILLGYLGESVLLRRREAFRLRDWVYTTGLTAIITAKADGAEGRATLDYDFLQFMADCVVTLHHRVSYGTAMRFLRVAKFRGAGHSANELPFSITQAGIEVASNTTLELDYPVSAERVSTGVDRLDAMLSGGYHRGSSVLITGAPGTAKTSLVAAFAAAAAERGERTVFVSFDEAPAQIIRNVASIGIQLQPHVDSGTLSLRSLRGHAESPETQVARLRELLRELQPRNLVIDPLSALVVRGSDTSRETAALQILDFAKSAGITVVTSSLLGSSMPLTEQTTLNVSTIADTWMHVSYVSQSGERNRALTIVKARGTSHSNQVRELVLGSDGVTLADVYTVDGDVLMGTLRWEKENEARRKSTAARHETVLRERKAELALAQTKAQLDTLARAQAIQEAELAQIKADTTMDVDLRTTEAEQLLLRRRADVGTRIEPEPEQ